MTCLIVPGLHSSGPDHWQTRWERADPSCRRVELGGWEDPERGPWVARLARAIEAADGCPIIVAHSLGCLAVAWWAGLAGDRAAKVTGALLVAPPDVERPGADQRIARFAPLPRRAMPFPTILVASRDDPYAAFDRSRAMATAWLAELHDAGAAGHLNADSGLGDWEEGRALVARLADTAASRWRRPRAQPAVPVAIGAPPQ